MIDDVQYDPDEKIYIDLGNPTNAVLGSPNRFTVSIEENDLLSAKIFPNPSSGRFTLQISLDTEECIVEFLSITGQIVKSQKAFSKGGILYESFDATDLSKGVYMLRVNGSTLRSGIVIY